MDEFVGIQELKECQRRQLLLFEQWCSERAWDKFHKNHYDWWTFPINIRSRFGAKYMIDEESVEILKRDDVFIQNLKRGAFLLLQSWGWNLYELKLIDNPDENQSWQNWSVRLYKCALSLKIFECERELRSVVEYANFLINSGYFLSHGKHNFYPFFSNLNEIYLSKPSSFVIID